MRLAVRLSTIVLHAVMPLLGGPPMGARAIATVPRPVLESLLAGLWTPIAGALAAFHALWQVFSSGHPWHWIMIATLCAALSLSRPAGSLDARLFGWKRSRFGSKSKPPPPFEAVL